MLSWQSFQDETSGSISLKASKELECDDLLVITWDHKGEEDFKGKKIEFVPLWKWLLGQERH
jgi:predicted AAA+ superfamily ATPase